MSDAKAHCASQNKALASFHIDRIFQSEVKKQDHPVWTGLHREGKPHRPHQPRTSFIGEFFSKSARLFFCFRGSVEVELRLVGVQKLGLTGVQRHGRLRRHLLPKQEDVRPELRSPLSLRVPEHQPGPGEGGEDVGGGAAPLPSPRLLRLRQPGLRPGQRAARRRARARARERRRAGGRHRGGGFSITSEVQ